MSIFRTFVEVRCWKCDIVYGMPETLNASRKRDGQGFFCPNGHEAAYKDTEADRLRRERDRLAQQVAYKDDRIKSLRDERDAADRRAAAARGQVTKIKNRVGAGVCPCCTRSFTNLRRHMETEHADYRAEAAE